MRPALMCRGVSPCDGGRPTDGRAGVSWFALKQRASGDGIRLMPGNNLGYFGPEEALLRSFHHGGRDHFAGCQAGKFVMAIESNGAVKGCPSLHSAHYIGGNLLVQITRRPRRARQDDETSKQSTP